MKKWILLSTVLLLSGATAIAVAQGGPHAQCSNKLMKGTYGYTCTGTVALPTGSVPIALIGVVTTDGKGRFEGPATANFNGTFMAEYLSTEGPQAKLSQVNPDCTGSITYEQYTGNPNRSDSTDLGPLPIKFVVLKDGKEIMGMPTSPGYVVTCHLVRVHELE